ncbi:cytochrome P450 [Streptomyces sp. NPDC058525]|uniref:cytochrome P450 family protein n=1 Tax=Streptomyces sp. NPDC058525 TaxID=3346538 RepID=UPI003655CC1D
MSFKDAQLFPLDPHTLDLDAESAELRKRGPLVPIELPGGVAAWVTTDYESARTALSHPQLGKAMTHWRAWMEGEIPKDWPFLGLVRGTGMLHSDGDDHRRIRKLVAPAFTGERIEALQPKIVGVAERLVADLAATGAGEIVDLRERFAYPLPMRVICEYMGVDDNSSARLRQPFDRLLMVSTPEEAVAAEESIQVVLRELIRFKRANPGTDLGTALIQARDNDDRLDEQELVDNLRLVISAGHETTVNLIASTVKALLENPGQLALLRDGTYPWSRAVEEGLRYAGPVRYALMRYAVEDTTIAGVVIPKGDPVVVALAAAGRDPGKCPAGEASMDSFDITRAQSPHLAFGHGAHHCPGTALARAEAEVALSTLFGRFPDLALADTDIAPLQSIALQGIGNLPVHLNGRHGGSPTA